MEIDPKDYEVAVAQAQANLANAEATAQSLNITVPITSVNTTSQAEIYGVGYRKHPSGNHRGAAAVDGSTRASRGG